MAWETYPTFAPTLISIISAKATDDSIFDFQEADALDIFMFSVIVLSLVISPLMIIFFIRKYLCLPKEAIFVTVKDEVMLPTMSCIGKNNRINMEDVFQAEDLESKFNGRSNASSVDWGYNANYIKCSHYKPQNPSVTFSV